MTRAWLVLAVSACRWGPTHKLEPRIPSQITITIDVNLDNDGNDLPIEGDDF
jgi:hypothetical protein